MKRRGRRGEVEKRSRNNRENRYALENG
jgi:hypothetical protein